jgi:hypothetical protein
MNCDHCGAPLDESGYCHPSCPGGAAKISQREQARTVCGDCAGTGRCDACGTACHVCAGATLPAGTAPMPARAMPGMVALAELQRRRFDPLDDTGPLELAQQRSRQALASPAVRELDGTEAAAIISALADGATPPGDAAEILYRYAKARGTSEPPPVPQGFR